MLGFHTKIHLVKKKQTNKTWYHCFYQLFQRTIIQLTSNFTLWFLNYRSYHLKEAKKVTYRTDIYT